MIASRNKTKQKQTWCQFPIVVLFFCITKGRQTMIALNSRIQLLHFDTQSPFPGAKVGPSDKTKTQRHIIRKKKKINKSDPMMKNKIRDISIYFVKCFLHQTATRYCCCCCCCCCSLSDGSVFYEFQNGRERERETGGREGRGNFVGTRHVPWISSAVHVLLCVCVCVCVFLTDRWS